MSSACVFDNLLGQRYNILIIKKYQRKNYQFDQKMKTTRVKMYASDEFFWINLHQEWLKPIF